MIVCTFVFGGSFLLAFNSETCISVNGGSNQVGIPDVLRFWIWWYHHVWKYFGHLISDMRLGFQPAYQLLVSDLNLGKELADH